MIQSHHEQFAAPAHMESLEGRVLFAHFADSPVAVVETPTPAIEQSRGFETAAAKNTGLAHAQDANHSRVTFIIAILIG